MVTVVFGYRYQRPPWGHHEILEHNQVLRADIGDPLWRHRKIVTVFITLECKPLNIILIIIYSESKTISLPIQKKIYLCLEQNGWDKIVLPKWHKTEEKLVTGEQLSKRRNQKYTSTAGFTTSHYSFPAIWYVTETIPTVSSKLTKHKDKTENSFTRVVDVVVESNDKSQDDHCKENSNCDTSLGVSQWFDLFHGATEETCAT